MGLLASGVDGFGLFVCGVLIPGWGGWYAVFRFPEVCISCGVGII